MFPFGSNLGRFMGLNLGAFSSAFWCLGGGGVSFQAHTKKFCRDDPKEDSERLGQGVSSGVGVTTNTGGKLCLPKENEMASSS
ncbi:hypothetical protein DSO57_1013578 [Entomophthora muscae]|uniref:Uncharacterized protein n=1 Tax=Entomophthora muscae TaxID=34485 RepID=A0ACC2S7Q1_9FUNG|nr:hypothetical protein DSO57_1013578 [Entomophthora muscae]